MNKVLSYTLIASFCFGLWPIIAQKSEASSGWKTFLITLICMLGIGLHFYLSGSHKGTIKINDILIIAGAGLINVVGWFAYQYLFGNASGAEFTKCIMILGIGVPVVAGIAGSLLLKGSLDVNKIIGLTLAVGAIYFVNK